MYINHFYTANTETFGHAESIDTQNMAENSGTSENSDTTVIYMHQKQDSNNLKQNPIPIATSPGKFYEYYYYCIHNQISI